MADRQTERENKYDVDPSFTVPDLTELIPAGGRVERSTVALESVYFDTAAHDLLTRGVTLRNRAGDADNGWQLKIPDGTAANSRSEIRLPTTAGDTDVPAELLALTAGLRRGEPLRHIATIRTHRGVARIVDAQDTLLVDIADDVVHSAAPSADGALLQEWREIETEFGAATGKAQTVLEKRLAKQLRRSGAVPAIRPNKVARALNGGAPATVTADAPHTAGAVIVEYLRQQDEALIAGDLALRQGEGAIHPTRVGTRRFRSTLRIFGDLFEADRAAAFDSELSWYAGVLGEVRDREVQRERMRKLLAKVPDELILGAVGARIEQELLSEQLHAQRELAAAMESERYFDLLRESRRWATEPPFVTGPDGTLAADADPKSLRHNVKKATRKLVKHLDAGLAADNDTELHKARKAGKRARYAAELTTPVLGAKKSGRLVSRYQKLQDTLGDHQDGVVSCELLKRLALGTVGKRTQNGFTYGLLYAQELERARVSRRKAEKLYAKL